MTTNTNDPNANATTVDNQNSTSGQDRNWEQARQKIANLESQLAAVTTLALEGIAHRAGHDPSTGVTSLLVKDYQSSLDGDLTKMSLEGFQEHAKSLGVEPVMVGDSGGEGDEGSGNGNNLPNNPLGNPNQPPSTPSPLDLATQQQMQTLQGRADQLGSQGTPNVPGEKTPDQSAAEALSKGDVDTAIFSRLQGTGFPL